VALYQVVAGRDQAAQLYGNLRKSTNGTSVPQDHALDEAKVGIETWWRATRGIHMQPKKPIKENRD
jgi:hypothetical protein